MLILGISFHFSIFVIHGLFSFFFAMAAALILYLIPAGFNVDVRTFFTNRNIFTKIA